MSVPPSPIRLEMMKISKLPESSSSSKPKERRTPSTLTGLTTSGQSLSQSTQRSWGQPEQWHGSSDDATSRTEPRTAFQAHENPWPFSSPSTEGKDLMPPMPYLSLNESRPTDKEKFGTPPQDEGYSTFDLEQLMNKAPWSMPSPLSYGRKGHGAPEPSSKFPCGYAPGYDIPMLLPDSPPYQ